MNKRTIAFYALVLQLLILTGCATDGDWRDHSGVNEQVDLGSGLLHKSQNEQARRIFSQALRHDPGNARAHWGLAIAYERLGRIEQADQHFRRALALGANAQIHNGYAVFLCDQGRSQAALKHFEQALDSPSLDQGQVLTNAGLCFFQNHQPDRAEHFFRQALQKEPQQTLALTHLARLTFQGQRHLSARAFIQRAEEAMDLDADLLLLAARTELALGDRQRAHDYLERYNQARPMATRTLNQLDSLRE